MGQLFLRNLCVSTAHFMFSFLIFYINQTKRSFKAIEHKFILSCFTLERLWALSEASLKLSYFQLDSNSRFFGLLVCHVCDGDVEGAQA